MPLWLLLLLLLVALGGVYLVYDFYIHATLGKNTTRTAINACRLPDQGPRPIANDAITKQPVDLDNVPSAVDAVVIGSGIGGLATAAMLARSGWKVVVLEQHDRCGGCCHMFTEMDCFEFDTGVHFIGKMNPEAKGMAQVLAMLSDNRIEWVSQGDPYDIVVTNADNDTSSKFDIMIGIEKNKQMLLQRFPHDQDAIEKFFALLNETSAMYGDVAIHKFAPLWYTKLTQALKSVGLMKRSRVETLGQRPGYKVIQELTDNKQLQSIFFYGLAAIGFPVDSSFAITAGVLAYYMTAGCWYPKGGGASIARELTATIVANGGNVFCKANVKEIVVEGGVAKGVIVTTPTGKRSTLVNAPIVVSNAGIPVTFAQLVPPSIAASSRYYPYSKPSGFGAPLHEMFIGLDGDADELKLDSKNHMFITGNDLIGDMMKYEKMTPEELLDSPMPFYGFMFPSCKDPTYKDRFPGKSVCIAATPASYSTYKEWHFSKYNRRPESYEDFKKTYMHMIWAKVVEHLPQLANRVEYMALGTPLTTQHYINAPGGSIAGITHNHLRFAPEHAANLRPETDVRNLWLTGQDTGFTGGISGALQGGLLTAGLLLQKHKQPPTVTNNFDKTK